MAVNDVCYKEHPPQKHPRRGAIRKCKEPPRRNDKRLSPSKTRVYSRMDPPVPQRLKEEYVSPR